MVTLSWRFAVWVLPSSIEPYSLGWLNCHTMMWYSQLNVDVAEYPAVLNLWQRIFCLAFLVMISVWWIQLRSLLMWTPRNPKLLTLSAVVPLEMGVCLFPQIVSSMSVSLTCLMFSTLENYESLWFHKSTQCTALSLNVTIHMLSTMGPDCQRTVALTGSATDWEHQVF